MIYVLSLNEQKTMVYGLDIQFSFELNLWNFVILYLFYVLGYSKCTSTSTTSYTVGLTLEADD